MRSASALARPTSSSSAIAASTSGSLPGLLGSTAESVTRKCPSPVLVCATDGRSRIAKPLLAYDGSQRAAAAMQAAATSADAALPLTVLTSTATRPPAQRVLDEAKRYLASYALQTTFELPVGSRARAASSPAPIRRRHDLLFIGAYGHSRIIEMVLGSTTEYVLRNATARSSCTGDPANPTLRIT